MNLQKSFLYYIFGLFYLGIFSSVLFGNLNNYFFTVSIIIFSLIFHKLFFEVFKILFKNYILLIYFSIIILISIYIPISDGDSLYYHYPISISFFDNGILKVPELTKVWNADVFAYYPSFGEYLQSLTLSIFRSDILFDGVQIIFLVMMIINITQNFEKSKKFIFILLSCPVILLNTISGANDIIITYLFLNIFISLWNILRENYQKINDEIIIIILSSFLLFATKYTAVIYLFFIGIFFLFYFFIYIKNKKDLLKNIYNKVNLKKIIIVFILGLIVGGFFYLRNYIYVGNPIFPLNLIGKINYATFYDFISQIIIDKDYYLNIYHNYNYGFGIFFFTLVLYLFFVNIKGYSKYGLFFLFIFSFFIFFWFFFIQTVPYHKYYIFIYILLFIFFIISTDFKENEKKLIVLIGILSSINFISIFPYFGDLQINRNINQTNFMSQIKNFSLENINNYKYIGKTFLLDESNKLNEYIQKNIKSSKILLSNAIFFQAWYNLSSIKDKNTINFLDNFISNYNFSKLSCNDIKKEFDEYKYIFGYNILQKNRIFGFQENKIFLKKINDGENRVQYKVKIKKDNDNDIIISYKNIKNSKNFVFYDGVFYKLDENNNQLKIKKSNSYELYFILFSENNKSLVFDSEITINSINKNKKIESSYFKEPVELKCFKGNIETFNDGKLIKIK